MIELKKSPEGRVEFWHDGKTYEPEDQIEGRTTASIVVELASPRSASRDLKVLAWYFLLRWEDGPQIARPQGIKGRTPKGDMVPLSFSIERKYHDMIPSKGQSLWLRNAVVEKLRTDEKI